VIKCSTSQIQYFCKWQNQVYLTVVYSLVKNGEKMLKCFIKRKKNLAIVNNLRFLLVNLLQYLKQGWIIIAWSFFTLML